MTLLIDQMPDRLVRFGDLLAPLLDPDQAHVLPAPAPPAGRRPALKPPEAEAERWALEPPVEVVRPKKVPTLPSERGLRGGVRFEVKLDGFRICGFSYANERPRCCRPARAATSPRTSRWLPVRLPSCRRAPSSMGNFAHGGRRLEFEQLLRTRRAREQGQIALAYVVFDLLALPGRDIRSRPLHQRLDHLDRLLRTARPPLQPILATTDRATALEWMEHLTAQGIEGVVAKGLDTPYDRHAGWVKVRHADTTDAHILALAGNPKRPTAVLLRLDDGTTLLSSPALDPAQAGALARNVSGLLGEQVHHAEHGTLTALTEPLLAEVRLGTGRHRMAGFIRIRASG
ncbi:hypothetical protein ACFQZC_00865 [Streptacidiphilus monticola]